MKKYIKMIGILVSVACLTACGEKSVSMLNPNAKIYTMDNEWLKGSVKEQAEDLKVLVNDEEYVYANASGMIGDVIEEARNASADFTKPVSVYTYDKNVMSRLLSEDNASYDDFSDVAKKVIDKKGISSFSSVVASKFGTNAMVMYSVFQTMQTYAVDKKCDNQMWLIPTDNEKVYILATVSSTDELYPLCTIMCSYIVSKDGNVLSTIEETMNELGIKATEM